MTDRIILKRYRALAQTYGADLKRWPKNERLAVERLTRDYEDINALQDARRLDALLDQWPDPDVPDGLAERVAVSLRQVAHKDIGGHQPIELTDIPGKGKPTFGTGRPFWWIGVGLAAALGGLATGSVAASTFLPDDPYDVGVTIFGDVSDLGE